MNVKHITGSLFGLLFAIGWAPAGWAQAGDPATPRPLVQQDDALEVSDHVYVILDDDVSFVANIGIIVGDRATLVIDSGLGLPSGEIVLGEARKLSDNETFYLLSTHYHPEHDLGFGAFPAGATMIRSRDQQADVDEFELSHAERFSRMSPTMAELLEGADVRPADVLFDEEYSVDLGGVTVRMYAVGPAHTRGDTLVYVEGEGVLFAGDVAMRRYPRFASPTSGVAVWLEALKALEALDVSVLVPSHGPLGDASTVDVNMEFFSAIQSRVGELKAHGRTADEIAQELIGELPPRFADWPDEGVERIASAVNAAFVEAP